MASRARRNRELRLGVLASRARRNRELRLGVLASQIRRNRELRLGILASQIRRNRELRLGILASQIRHNRKLRLGVLASQVRRNRKLRLGVLASHGGSNLQSIMDACERGRLSAEVGVVISNNSRSRALARARAAGIPAYHISGKKYPGAALLDDAIRDCLAQYDVELVLLAGYMKLLGGATLARYRGRVLNSHPALLPKFGGKGMYGSRVHQEVLKAGERVTGVTIHQVDAWYDHGATLEQCEVKVRVRDTLADLEERVKRRERRFWIETLNRIADGEIDLSSSSYRALHRNTAQLKRRRKGNPNDSYIIRRGRRRSAGGTGHQRVYRAHRGGSVYA